MKINVIKGKDHNKKVKESIRKIAKKDKKGEGA